MSNTTLRIHVSTRAAILAGKARIGVQPLDITEHVLGELTGPQRLEIALLLEGADELGSLPGDPLIAEPTVQAIIPALDARVAQRKAIDDAKRIADARATEEAAVVVRESATKEGLRKKSLREWINANGDEEQKARMAEGFLRDEEVLDAVMDDKLDLSFPRYETLRRGDACDCACAGAVEFIQQAPTYMDSAQFARLTAVRENAPEGATVESVEHKAKCPACTCVPIARITARVSLPWGGWVLVRDFSLG